MRHIVVTKSQLPDKNVPRVDVIVGEDNLGPETEDKTLKPVNFHVQINSSNNSSCCPLFIRNLVYSDWSKFTLVTPGNIFE